MIYLAGVVTPVTRSYLSIYQNQIDQTVITVISQQKNQDGYPVVTSTYKEEWVSYQYIGSSFSGVHIIQTWSNGGGSGVFTNILLFTLSSDSSLKSNGLNYTKKPRFVIKLVGSLPLGDRYQGKVNYKYGLLSISPCTGMKSFREKGARIVVL
jgi:hypothetical protein